MYYILLPGVTQTGRVADCSCISWAITHRRGNPQVAGSNPAAGTLKIYMLGIGNGLCLRV